jgi:Protein of unknown function (DUF3551)
MTRFSSTLFVAFVLVFLVALILPTKAIEYPWCAQYGGMADGGRNCGFSTLAQCMATVSGIGGGCERNLFYEGPTERSTAPSRKHNKPDR